VGVDNEEARIEGILKKIALLCKTRGVVFLACFQDCERSDATSLVTPRYSGKVTPAQFHQHFPLIGDFEPKEMLLLVKRYMNGNGDINYQALDRDIKEAALLVPPPAGAHTAGKRVPQTPRSPSTGKQVSSTRYRREVALQETLQSVDVMEKLKAVVSERRLRLADCFADFDKLRKGFCTVNQLRTVFTVLGIELSNNDYASLAELFCNQEGLFCYREFCNAVCEIHALNLHSWDMELPTTPSTNREDCRPGSRIRYKAPLDESAQDRQAELEIRIKKRADVRSLNLKRCFQDFDRVCAGHVTRLQFHRIMDMLHCELSSDDADTLCQAYCDTDNGQEFNYIDFCDSVKQYGIVGEQTPIAVTVSRRPKYFDRSGESITPYTPVQMNTGPYPEDVHSGVLPWSRPCTR
jgi:Ca2+-binding EF-hand superfamily protein